MDPLEIIKLIEVGERGGYHTTSGWRSLLNGT